MSVKKGSFSSQSTCPQGSLALQINKAGPPDSSSAALLLREHAKTARENSAINGQGRARPARGPRRPIHQQPRRRWALSSTAELALRPPTCGCSTGPRTSRPRGATTSSAEYKHTAQPFRAPEISRARQKQRSRPRDKQEARQRAEQRTTERFNPPIQTSATPTVLTASKQRGLLRRRASAGPALTCLTRRRCRTALLALGATATSDPFFRRAVVLQNEDSQPLITTHSCFTSGAQPGVVHIHMKNVRPRHPLRLPQARATGRGTAGSGCAGLPQARGEDRRAQRPSTGLRRADGHRAQEVQRGPGAGLRAGRVRGDVRGREPHL